MDRKGLIVFLGLLSVAGRAQQGGNARPEFEVASIKPANPSVAFVRLKSGRATLTGTNVSLQQCIEKAYGVDYLRITGPALVNAEKYTILAKASSAVPETQLMLMFQALLTDRFKLAFHRENRETAVYALIAGKNPKLHPSADDGIEPEFRTRDGAVIARRLPLRELATYLTILRTLVHLDMPVVDMTGIDGSFDLTLNYADPGADPADRAAAISNPPIFRFVESQLGLKLVPRKASLEYFIVGHAERASEN